MADFIHLHAHSDYSLLNATSTIEQIVNFAAEQSMSHIALTDNGNLFGAIEFYNACVNKGIKPIIGCDFFHTEGSRASRTVGEGGQLSRLALLAISNSGYRNLVELTSRAFTEGFYYRPRIDDELLQEYNEGLVAFCGGTRGDVACHVRANRPNRAEERIHFYRGIFGRDNFYIELQDHNTDEEQIINKELIALARRHDTQLLATNNTFYTAADDAEAHNVLLCIGKSKKIFERGMIFPSDQYYLKSAQAMSDIFADTPEAVENTRRVAEQCALDLQFPGPEMPAVAIPAEFATPIDYLRHLAERGLRNRYSQITPSLQSRLNYELDTIDSMGFAGYFLIIWDLVDYAHNNGIAVGPGRGSGAGSLIAYCLKITDTDPIKYRLLFERFLNPERVSLPDFDIDFCYEKRPLLIDYMTKKYGHEHVCQIITFGTLGARGVVRDVARVLGISLEEANAIGKHIGKDTSLEQALNKSALQDIRRRGGPYDKLFTISAKLEGLHRHASTHAAGIVVGRRELKEYVPLYRDSRSKNISTQFSMEHLEDCGLVKMDILGLKTLTLVEDCQRLIREHTPEFDIEAIPDNDAPTFDMLSRGESVAVFQFENSGMQALLKRACPERIEDLIALTSLYRPGPIEHVDQYVKIRNGSESVRYPLPELQDILEETCGIIIYQEQVMEIARTIAGFSLSRADIMRRAMGKKKPAEMAKMRTEFINGAEKNNISSNIANEIYDLLAPFAEYGFNKSHAASYSILAYKTAFLKAHYPREFMAANLTNEINNRDKFYEYLQETKRLGIRVIPPSLHRSAVKFSVQDGDVVFGFNAIQTLGEKAASAIVRARNKHKRFKSFIDFAVAVDRSIMNKTAFEAAIKTGVFDEIEPNRALLFHNLPSYYSIARVMSGERASGQQSMFSTEEVTATESMDATEFSAHEIASFEREYLGGYFSRHPLDDYAGLIKRAHATPLDAFMDGAIRGQRIIIGIVVEQPRLSRTKKNTPMLSITIEDRTQRAEIVRFYSKEKGSADEQQQKIAADMKIVKAGAIIGASVDMFFGKDTSFITVKQLYSMQQLEMKYVKSLHIKISPTSDAEQSLHTIRSLLLEHNGKSNVYFHIENDNDAVEVIRASAQFSVDISDHLHTELTALPVVSEVWQK